MSAENKNEIQIQQAAVRKQDGTKWAIGLLILTALAPLVASILLEN